MVTEEVAFVFPGQVLFSTVALIVTKWMLFMLLSFPLSLSLLLFLGIWEMSGSTITDKLDELAYVEVGA